MEQLIETIKAALWNMVWAANLANLPPAQAFLVRSVRTGHMVFRELIDGQLNLRAASLVYTTLLSLIPALAVSFAVMKAFNVHESLEPFLLQSLQPLGSKGPEIVGQIIGFVENLDLAKLGSAGLGVLMLTVVSLLHKTEQALNQAWRVERARRFFERLSGYLTVVMVGPVLVMIAVGMSAKIASSDVVQSYSQVHLLGFALKTVTSMVPYLLVIAAFSFIYIYIPNTRVRIKSAIVGGVVAGILWGSMGWFFASMVVNTARYTVVYSSFAILILFMMWLHIGWLIVLIGGSVSFYHQNPEYLGLLRHELQMSNRVRERLGLMACLRVATAFHNGQGPPSLVELARDMRVPVAPLQSLMRALESAGIVTRAAGDVVAYLPARSLDRISIDELLDSLRRAHESGHINIDRVGNHPGVESVLTEVDELRHQALGARTLADLAAMHAGDTPTSEAVPDSAGSGTEVGDAAASPPEPVALRSVGSAPPSDRGDRT